MRKNAWALGLAVFVGLACSRHGKADLSVSQANPDLVTFQCYVSKDGVPAGQTVKMALRIKIAKNWHIHGPKLDDEFLIPTALLIDESETMRIAGFHYPPPKSAKFEYSDVPLLIYDDEVILGALAEIRPDHPLGMHKIAGKLRYQACDDASCKPPKTMPFEVSFEVVLPDRETREIHPEIFSKMEFQKPPVL